MKGKHAFVTGAGKRLGRAIAEMLIAEGVHVTAHYRHSQTEAEEVVQLAAASHLKSCSVSADLSDPGSLKSAVLKARDKVGKIDILINSASDFFPTPATECTETQWNSLNDVNLRGQFFLAQACLPDLIQNRGSLINIIDVYAERPLPRYAAYAASKGGLLALTKTLAKELAPNVRVNGISPGAVLLPDWYTEEQREKSRQHNLLGRLGSPNDIAEGVRFLLKNTYVTGFNLKIDGGKSLM